MCICYFCGNSFEGKVYKTTVCPDCGKELKICMNCLHYDPSAHHECREPQAEYVQDKEKANFCDYFIPGGKPGRRGTDKSDEAKKKFEDLFS